MKLGMAMMSPTNKLPLKEQISIAAQLAVRARRSFDVWWVYRGRGTRSKILPVMNEYLDYFRADEHAHLVSLVVHIGALHDHRGDTVGLPVLIKEVRDALGTRASKKHKEILLRAERTLRRNEDVIGRVKKLRHKAFAHRDNALSYDDIFRVSSIKPNNLRRLIDTSLSVANLLTMCVGGLPVHRDAGVRRDTRRVMKKLGVR